MTRMNDMEYMQAFGELESATELSDAVLEQLTMIADECDLRGMEMMMRDRPRRGQSSSQSRRFINLVNSLEEKFGCTLGRRDHGATFEIRSAR